MVEKVHGSPPELLVAFACAASLHPGPDWKSPLFESRGQEAPPRQCEEAMLPTSGESCPISMDHYWYCFASPVGGMVHVGHGMPSGIVCTDVVPEGDKISSKHKWHQGWRDIVHCLQHIQGRHHDLVALGKPPLFCSDRDLEPHRMWGLRPSELLPH